MRAAGQAWAPKDKPTLLSPVDEERSTMWLESDVLNISAPVSLEQPGGQVTIVEGSSFCLSGRAGDIRPGASDGLFVLDVRVLSGWELLLDGRALEPLSVSVSEPFSATFVARGRPPTDGESTSLVVRRRWVGSGMREDLELHNYSSQEVTHQIELKIASDFADLFAVKAGRPSPAPDETVKSEPLHARSMQGSVLREVLVTENATTQRANAGPAGLSWTVTVPPKGVWRTCLEVSVRINGQGLALQYRCGETPQLSRPAKRLADWRQRTPVLRSGDPRLDAAIARSIDDISSLVIEDPLHPQSPVVAAGAPWFMALFGRDSLLTSYMTMIVDPALAIGTLQTLARLQGKNADPLTEEQPGRILHEVRFNSSAATDIDDGHIYYGTADATPLFVVLIGELSRWGVERSVVDDLLPHADRALEWIEHYGDHDGDGYVEYERSSTQGLANQGWKDSWDGINAADGALATTPIALAEVQGYVYAAYLARADLATERGDEPTSTRYRDKASALRAAFNRDFWLPERGWYAIALDGEKKPVDSLASNMGHCLWSGIIDPDRADAVAAHLMSPAMFSGWGVRTLATTMSRYNPLSYHNGSVWPHDCAIAAAGLMRYGYVEESRRIIDAILDAAVANNGRLPELYAGVAREDLPVPVAYPTSCSPQAWSSAAPLLILRTLLRFEPRLDLGVIQVAPVDADRRVGEVQISLADSRLEIRSTQGGAVEISGVPQGVALVRELPSTSSVPRPQR
jgi:glycogen debranching enzyme